MNVEGLGEIKAVAFDIDGTLYPQWKIHLSAVFSYACHIIFYLYYGLVRNEMHRIDRVENFRAVQAEKMAAFMHCSAQEAESKLNAVVYDGLKKNFEKIPCYKDVPETFIKFKEAGLKLALLSDFPDLPTGSAACDAAALVLRGDFSADAVLSDCSAATGSGMEKFDTYF